MRIGTRGPSLYSASAERPITAEQTALPAVERCAVHHWNRRIEWNGIIAVPLFDGVETRYDG
jgi:hypothetical protein